MQHHGLVAARESFLRVAQITFAIRCGDGRIAWQWDRATERFLVDPSLADVELDVRVADAIPPAAGRLLFDSGAVWRMYRENDVATGFSPSSGGLKPAPTFRVECRSELFGADPYKIAFFDDSFTRGTIHLAPAVLGSGVSPLNYPLDEVLLAHLLGRGRGVELHSCGVIDRDGRGHLFAGVSGAGKTTTARLWEPSASGIVSDDRVVVREQDGALWMYGTPWHGEAELALPVGAPLAGVYLLVQAEANELRALPQASAVARLFRCAFPPFYDAAAVDFTLSFLQRLAERVPVRELRFTRDPSVVDLVRAESA